MAPLIAPASASTPRSASGRLVGEQTVEGPGLGGDLAGQPLIHGPERPVGIPEHVGPPAPLPSPVRWQQGDRDGKTAVAGELTEQGFRAATPPPVVGKGDRAHLEARGPGELIQRIGRGPGVGIGTGAVSPDLDAKDGPDRATGGHQRTLFRIGRGHGRFAGRGRQLRGDQGNPGRLMGNRAPGRLPTSLRFRVLDCREEIEHGPVEIIEARPGVARSNHGRRIAATDATRRRRGEPEVLRHGEAGLELGHRQRDPVEQRGGPAVMSDPGDAPPDAVPLARLELGDRPLAQLPCRPDRHEPGERPADPEQPVGDQQGDLLGEALLEAQPDQVSARELPQLSRPGSHGDQAAARPAPDPADGEDQAALLDPAEVPTPATETVPLPLHEEDVDTAGDDQPDRLDIVQGQGEVGGGPHRHAVREQLLDDEARLMP
jgi:hypothetical protein